MAKMWIQYRGRIDFRRHSKKEIGSTLLDDFKPKKGKSFQRAGIWLRECIIYSIWAVVWRTSHRQWWDKNKYIRPTLWGVAVCHILSLGPSAVESLYCNIFRGERMSSIYNNKRRLIYTQKALYYYYNGMYICIAFILYYFYIWMCTWVAASFNTSSSPLT